jgi:DNA-binding transcriptional LysR family regulator
MNVPRTTAEQWAVLAAIVDAGGFSQAAKALHRSQSAISYSVAQLQQAVGLPLLRIEGRRARLTPAGEALLRRSRLAVDQLRQLESVARSLAGGWESELSLVVDAAYPQQRLFAVLAELREACGETTVNLTDAVLSGAEEAITAGSADVVVTTRVPSGVLGDWLMDVPMVAVAAPSHPLLRTGGPLEAADLASHAQVVVRDSGRAQPRDEGWLGARQRWTVSSVEASLAAVRAGLAFAWLPAHRVDPLLATGELRALPLQAGATRLLALYVVLVKGEAAGPAARTAVELLQRHVPAVEAGGDGADTRRKEGRRAAARKEQQ